MSIYMFFVLTDLYDNPKCKHMSSCMYRWGVQHFETRSCIPAVF